MENKMRPEDLYSYIDKMLLEEKNERRKSVIPIIKEAIDICFKYEYGKTIITCMDQNGSFIVQNTKHKGSSKKFNTSIKTMACFKEVLDKVPGIMLRPCEDKNTIQIRIK